MEVACLDCTFRDAAGRWIAEFRSTQTVPPCPDCGGRLKHATVSFGQSLPASELQTAWKWAKQATLFLVIGSSLQVTPAAELPRVARQAGATLVIVNQATGGVQAIGPTGFGPIGGLAYDAETRLLYGVTANAAASALLLFSSMMSSRCRVFSDRFRVVFSAGGWNALWHSPAKKVCFYTVVVKSPQPTPALIKFNE